MKLIRIRRKGSRSDDLSCPELVRLVTDYLEGAMSKTDRRRFDAHLDACDGCGTYLEQMRDTVTVAGVLAEDSVDPVARDALLTAFRKWKAAP
jgi:anti-sigma factor RsiW